MKPTFKTLLVYIVSALLVSLGAVDLARTEVGSNDYHAAGHYSQKAEQRRTAQQHTRSMSACFDEPSAWAHGATSPGACQGPTPQ